jgi:hypothetical protein
MLRRESAAQVASAGLPGDQKCSGHRDAGFLEARRGHRRVVRPDQQRSPTRTGSAIAAGEEGDCDRQRQVTPRPFPRPTAPDPPGVHVPNLGRIRASARASASAETLCTTT